MQIEQTLKKIGLTETESKIYLTGLAYTTISVNELMKKTQINRTTIYHALNTLLQKGLASKKNTSSKLVFSMTPPSGIENLIDEKIALLNKQKKYLNEIIPLLNEKIIKQEEKTKVFHYEGIEGVKLAIEDAYYCKSSHWDLISPKKNFFSEFDNDYAKYFIETRKNKGITTRSLWEPDPGHKDLKPETLKERNPRILPTNMHGKFKSVICLYDDKVLLISSLEELTAVIIQSQELSNTMTTIFEGLWFNSKPIK